MLYNGVINNQNVVNLEFGELDIIFRQLNDSEVTKEEDEEFCQNMMQILSNRWLKSQKK